MKNFIKGLIVFILINICVYLIGSFLAWDFNVNNWWFIKDIFGRFIMLIIEIIMVGLTSVIVYD